MQLHRERTELARRGADLVFVGNGGVHFGRAFRQDLAIEAPVYVDPGLGAYRALGMRRGVMATLTARALAHAARALRGGFRQGAVQGDAWQLGGVLVVQPGGAILFEHLSREAGDHPAPGAILAALPAPAAAAGPR